MCELNGLWGRFLEDKDITKLLFFDTELLFEVYNPLIIRLELDADLPIDASLFKELDKEDVENTDFINPFMLLFLSLDESPPVMLEFLSLKLFWILSKSSYILLSISLLNVFMDAFLAEFFTSLC